MSTIADRIHARLQALGKNPSAIALEAGLGRSSVRDILVGKVSSPRLDTLQKLTEPLECTLEYLTGSSVDLSAPEQSSAPSFFDSYETNDIINLEIGAFRTEEALRRHERAVHADFPSDDRHLVYDDFRLVGHHFSSYRLIDTSLLDIHILPGDILTAGITGMDDRIPLKRGTIVIIRRQLRENRAEEWSARYVDIRNGNIVLTSRSRDPRFKEIEIVDNPGMDEAMREYEEYLPNSIFTRDGNIEVRGLVVRITRQISI